MKYIHTLTGLRGFAALIVFISHSANQLLLPEYLGEGFGQIGVMIFFILSGFLMSHLYIKDSFDCANVKRYALARIGRVIPLYFLLLLLSIVISNYIDNNFHYNLNDPGMILRAFLLIDAPYEFWTIPVEVQFYFSFVVFWYLYQRGVNYFLLVLFVLLTMLPAAYLYLQFDKPPRVLSFYAYAFFIGVGTSLVQNYFRNSASIRKLASIAGYPLLILLFLNLPVLRERYGLVYHGDAYLRTWGDPITWAIIYGLFICAILNSKSLTFLNLRPFVYLGNISYGFYLMHYPILKYCIALDLNSYVQLILAFCVTAGLAHLSYKYFERPTAKLIRKSG
jgi:peptidoglycan/LPS O-acetylase OafA/YrhL